MNLFLLKVHESFKELDKNSLCDHSFTTFFLYLDDKIKPIYVLMGGKDVNTAENSVGRCVLLHSNHSQLTQENRKNQAELWVHI